MQGECTVFLNQKIASYPSTPENTINQKYEDTIDRLFTQILKDEISVTDQDMNKWWMVINENYSQDFTDLIPVRVEDRVRDFFRDVDNLYVLGINRQGQIEERQHRRAEFNIPRLFLSFPTFQLYTLDSKTEYSIWERLYDFIFDVCQYLNNSYSDELGQFEDIDKDSIYMKGYQALFESGNTSLNIAATMRAISRLVYQREEYFLNHVSPPIRGVLIINLEPACFKKIIDTKSENMPDVTPLNCIGQFSRILAISKIASESEKNKMREHILLGNGILKNEDNQNYFDNQKLPTAFYYNSSDTRPFDNNRIRREVQENTTDKRNIVSIESIIKGDESHTLKKERPL